MSKKCYFDKVQYPITVLSLNPNFQLSQCSNYEKIGERLTNRRTGVQTDKRKNDLNKALFYMCSNIFVSDGFTKIDPTKIYIYVNDI
jgi:hypothetical protein